MTIKPSFNETLGMNVVNVKCDACGYSTSYVEIAGDVEVLFTTAEKITKRVENVVTDMATIHGIWDKYTDRKVIE